MLTNIFIVEDRRTWFETVDEMQTVLDAHLIVYNTKRPRQGRGMKGRTPETVFCAGLSGTSPLLRETKTAAKHTSKTAEATA